MKYRLLILLFLLSSVLTTTAQKKYDAVFKKIDKSYTLHADGSIDYTYRKELQLNSQRSFDKMYGETFIVYNPDFQSLTINEAYTIRKDGSRVNTPANAFNEVLPSNCTDCGRYNGVKEMVVTHTALEYGATIVLDYTIHQKAGLLKDMSEILVLAESSPVEQYRVSFTFPKEKKYLFKGFYQGPDNSTHTYKDGYETVTATFSSLRQTSAEPSLPAAVELYPNIKFYSADNEEMLETILRQPALTRTELPECDLVLSQITSPDKEYVNNILAIRDWVVDNVHYNALSFKYNGYNIADANTVWKSNCGNEPEKAVLLAAMLQRAGYDARIGVMLPADLKEFAVAAISRWAVWTRDPLTNSPLILSPITKNQASLTSLHPEEQLFLLKEDNNLEVLFEERQDHTTLGGVMTLKEDGTAEGNLSATICHNNLPAFELLKTDNKASFNKFIKNIKVEADNIQPLKNRAGWHIDYKVQGFSKKEIGGGYFSMMLPEDNLSAVVSANRLTASRQEPLACTPTALLYELTVYAPEGCRIVNKSAHLSETQAFGTMDIRIDANPNGSVTIRRQLTITQDRIPTSQYAKFRKMMVEWQDDTYRRIVFKKSEE
ncbi:MAG: DUF3857 domain-containing protein [Bacteroidales bacterium]|nr:DUF3857 domain-containing protein [Bacteroidales bacterium]